MSLRIELSAGIIEPASGRAGSGRQHWHDARMQAAICMSIAALVTAVPAQVDAGEFDPPAASDQARLSAPPRLVVAPIVEVDSPGQADCRVNVSRAESLPSGAYIRVRGLPAEATLSSGQPDPADQTTPEHTWVVPLQGLADLKVEVPRGVSGSSELHVALLDDDGRVVAERTSVLRIAAPVVVAPAKKKVLAAPAAPPPETVVVASPEGPANQPQRKPEEITTSALSPPSGSELPPRAPPSENGRTVDRGPPAAPPPKQVAVASPESPANQPQHKPEEIATSARSPSSGPELPLRALPARPGENGGPVDRGPPAAPPPEKVAVASPESPANQPQRKPEEITTSALSPSAPELPLRAPPTPARPRENGRAVDRGPASSEDLAQAGRLVTKGEGYFAQGNVAVAREYFQRAADLGLPLAALKMAETLDARELASRRVQGVKPDPAAAKRWYQRALELNVPEAEARLRRLGSQ
jgi:hypothetical protein